MKRSDLVFISLSFLIWKIAILLIASFAIKFIPIFSQNFFGGGFNTYQTNPLFWGHMNFDGEHYLALAQNGYQPLTYFFFPLFSNLVKILSNSKDIFNLAWIGLLVSNLSFFISLIGIYKLVGLDYKKHIAKMCVILFLVFPTSFYFGSFYTESLFLSLVVWSFYFARRKNFLIAATLAAFASSTRIIGVALLPCLVVEFLLQNKERKIVDLIKIIFISPLGLISYMYFLLRQTGDPLIFLHQISIYGGQRSSAIILLPQVFYRYIFKILPTVNYSNFPNIFTTYMEIIIATIFLSLIIFGIFKLRLSYSVYAVLAFITPTLAGSFSSMPRYVLVIFPCFILGAVYLQKTPKIYKLVIIFVMIILMAISTTMFWRGYWIS